MITILSMILFFLLLITGKSRGTKTFVTFFLSIILIITYIILISLGMNAIILALIVCILASCISLFMLNGYNLKTLSSFISIMIVLVFITILTYSIGKISNIQGFSSDSVETIGAFSYLINYDMTKVIIGMYLICVIGTIIDTSISVSSSMNEVLENNPKINEKELYKSGMNVGGDILSTTINTLFFAIISSFIGFFMWHRNSPIENIINHKVFTQTVIELLLSFIASILIIPITSYISSKILYKKNLIKDE